MSFNQYRLFCIPYAGGSSSIYYKWDSYLSEQIILEPLELSGHGEKMDQQCKTTIEEMAEDLLLEMKEQGKFDKEYAFFGHSMGTMVICELIKRIRAHGYKEPCHVFMSGRFPPHLPEKEELHQLSDEDFLNKIIAMGGVPESIVAQREILEFFLEPLRADYTAVESYRYQQMEKWNVPISVLLGKKDMEVKDYDYFQWRDYSVMDCNFYEFDSGHFFINEFIPEITELIHTVLKIKESKWEKGGYEVWNKRKNYYTGHQRYVGE